MPVAFTISDDYVVRAERMSGQTDEIVKKSMYAGLKIIADASRASLSSVIKHGTGALISSMGITPISQDNYGNWTAHVGFDGYGPGHVANQLKARALESGAVVGSRRAAKRAKIKIGGYGRAVGQYRIKPTHWASKAISSVRTAAADAVQKTMEELIKKASEEG